MSAFLKLRDADRPSFLLESAEQGRVGRYSFIGYRPRKVLRWSLGDPGDPYQLAADELSAYTVPQLPGLPPFFGGAVGVFAYDLVRTVEPLGEPNPDPVGVPDLALMLTDALVAFDHLKHTVTVIANVYVSDDEDLETSLQPRLRHDRRGSLATGRSGAASEPAPGPAAHRADASSRTWSARSSRRSSAGSSSTSMPATRSRSCRHSGGRPRSPCRRSRSIAG